MIQRSMKAKFVAAAAAILIAVMLITSVTIYFQLAGDIEQSVDENATAFTEDTERYIQEFMEKYDITVDTLAQNPQVENFAAGDDAEDAWQDITSIHEAYMEGDDGIQLMYIGEEDGSFTSTPEIDVPDDFDVRERPWYIEAEENEGATAWTSPYIDIDTGELVITAARTIETGGVKSVDISLNAMVDALESVDIGYEGELALVDDEGLIIAHTDEAQIGEEAAEGSLTAQAAADQEAGSISSGGETAYHRTIDGFDWSIVAHYDDDVLYQELSTIQQTFLVVTFAALAVGMVGAYFAGSRFTRPVREMRNHVRNLAEGNFTEEVPVRSRDEVGELGTALNMMTAQLRELIGSLQRSADNTRSMSEGLSATSEETAATSEDIFNAVQDVAKGSTQQAGAIEDINDKMQQLSASIDQAEKQTADMTDVSGHMREAN
ncbi:methyl-accepting chemotaxis protein [Alkalicoccus chagannorensis]|uniref:methyl-accepting chemotaxis protein n=1 Tax=Alkalicoccus chagannorensis TaxID=427072 RepID=UPI0004070E9B|nr:methyl-accepting chemotaxis protein [Alkalicoccus chagannorensis]